ncbi:hypothetical protein KSP40_PGU015048 [Platanthera guangdongensis]|uniref:TFIIS central domain-containing protein n=1 Tax=Platanthera guangdongensis TaxID=2320717 RepID=A0ABR2LGJ8_9ASPA
MDAVAVMIMDGVQELKQSKILEQEMSEKEMEDEFPKESDAEILENKMGSLQKLQTTSTMAVAGSHQLPSINKRPTLAEVPAKVKGEDESVRSKLSVALSPKRPKFVPVEENKDVKDIIIQTYANLAGQIEADLFKFFGGVNKKYKEKGRSLLFNLKDPSNPELREQVLSGDLSPRRLCSMTAEELASKELSQWRQAKAEEFAHMVLLPDMNFDIRRLVRKTHKGEFQVEVEQDDGAHPEVGLGLDVLSVPLAKCNEVDAGRPRSNFTGPTLSRSHDSEVSREVVQGDKSDSDERYVFHSSDPRFSEKTHYIQDFIVEEMKDTELLPPVVSLDEFMQDLDSEPPFGNSEVDNLQENSSPVDENLPGPESIHVSKSDGVGHDVRSTPDISPSKASVNILGSQSHSDHFQTKHTKENFSNSQAAHNYQKVDDELKIETDYEKQVLEIAESAPNCSSIWEGFCKAREQEQSCGSPFVVKGGGQEFFADSFLQIENLADSNTLGGHQAWRTGVLRIQVLDDQASSEAGYSRDQTCFQVFSMCFCIEAISWFPDLLVMQLCNSLSFTIGISSYLLAFPSRVAGQKCLQFVAEADIVEFRWKEDSPESGQLYLAEAIHSYIADERVGFAEPAAGVELYLCPPRSKLTSMLGNHLSKDLLDNVDSVSSHQNKHAGGGGGSKRQSGGSKKHRNGRNRLPAAAHGNPTRPQDMDDIPPGFGPHVSREAEDLPEFDFSSGGKQHFAGRALPGPPAAAHVRELIQKYGQGGGNVREMGIPVQAWNEEDDIPEWNPNHDAKQMHVAQSQPMPPPRPHQLHAYQQPQQFMMNQLNVQPVMQRPNGPFLVALLRAPVHPHTGVMQQSPANPWWPAAQWMPDGGMLPGGSIRPCHFGRYPSGGPRMVHGLGGANNDSGSWRLDNSGLWRPDAPEAEASSRFPFKW